MTYSMFLSFAAVFMILVGCHTVANKSTSEPAETPASSSNIPPRCLAHLDECGADVTDIVCTVDKYDGAILPDWRLLKGWGRSVCRAHNNLKMRACSAGLEISKLAKVSCSPDVSEGECVLTPAECTLPGEPTLCFAATYDGIELKADQIVAGRGNGECEARQALSAQACVLNLRPSKLENISCLHDKAPDPCLASSKSCPDEYFPFICEGRMSGGTLKRPYDARVFAENSCLAEMKLHQIACNLNLSPKKIKSSRCYPDR